MYQRYGVALVTFTLLHTTISSFDTWVVTVTIASKIVKISFCRITHFSALLNPEMWILYQVEVILLLSNSHSPAHHYQAIDEKDDVFLTGVN